jgi:hypothetical protein
MKSSISKLRLSFNCTQKNLGRYKYTARPTMINLGLTHSGQQYKTEL